MGAGTAVGPLASDSQTTAKQITWVAVIEYPGEKNGSAQTNGRDRR